VAKFVKGDVVVIPFPFSDLSQYKRRPALVWLSIPGGAAKEKDLLWELCELERMK